MNYIKNNDRKEVHKSEQHTDETLSISQHRVCKNC